MAPSRPMRDLGIGSRHVWIGLIVADNELHLKLLTVDRYAASTIHLVDGALVAPLFVRTEACEWSTQRHRSSDDDFVGRSCRGAGTDN